MVGFVCSSLTRKVSMKRLSIFTLAVFIACMFVVAPRSAQAATRRFTVRFTEAQLNYLVQRINSNTVGLPYSRIWFEVQENRIALVYEGVTLGQISNARIAFAFKPILANGQL